MEINLNITATEICGALNNLASAILGMGSNKVSPSEQAEQGQATTRKSKVTKTADTAATETAAKVVQAATQTVTVTEDQPAAEENPEFTLEEVRAKLATLSAAGHAPKIKELFSKFGAKKLTEVPKENYTELMAAAEEIE